MLAFSADMMATLTREHFLQRVGRFVEERCRCPALRGWVRAQPADGGAWRAAWPLVSGLSEHDCALVLVFVAACECEGLTPPPVAQLVAALPQREVGFKQFLSGRGYFAFRLSSSARRPPRLKPQGSSAMLTPEFSRTEPPSAVQRCTNACRQGAATDALLSQAVQGRMESLTGEPVPATGLLPGDAAPRPAPRAGRGRALCHPGAHAGAPRCAASIATAKPCPTRAPPAT